MYSDADKLINILSKLLPKNQNIPLHEPVFCGNEEKYVQDCIKTGWVSSVGSYVDAFENKISDFVKCRFAVSTVNGTSALHLALKTLGINANEEILLPSLTFIATANAVSYCGGIPHFVDVESDTFGVDSKKLEIYLNDIVNFKDGFSFNKFTKRKITCIIVMHCFGMPAKGIEDIQEICKKFNLFLVEDAAEALGSYHCGTHTGNFSDIGIFSFNGNKIITTGGGGMLVTNNKEYEKKARHLATTGKEKNYYKPVHDIIAYNYRMPNINAALGLAQLEQIGNFINKKRALAEIYKNKINFKGIKILIEPLGTKSNYWLNSLIFDDSNTCIEVLEKTNNEGINTRLVWEPLHQSKPYQNNCFKMDLETTEFYSKKILNIPSSSNLLK